ncbi:MAG: SpoIIE family protein phosphatase [Crocinitomicaceae bacterium]|nr:SpoIIE family protein phosphatase [Flavobacteriales bacterium]NQZ35606.1 SpoIIE family protein phosphatase [Crocinitomicaceae bacterium]
MKSCLTILILFTFYCFGQDQLVIDEDASVLGVSVADQLTVFESIDSELSPSDFLARKGTFEGRRMTKRSESFDFTASSFFIHFRLSNESLNDLQIVLETARPFTNRVNLYCVDTKETVYSGDAIPFDSKCLPSNFSALTLSVPSGETREYVLQLVSEGENLSIPVVFFDRKEYMDVDSNRHMFIGIFLGIFIFVIVIYLAFFAMLKERLFLIYVLYAAFSGLLQFAVDGYMHQFVFTSGGYFTQHCVIFIAGGTVILGMLYAIAYLALTGILKKIGSLIIALVLVTMVLSLIPDIHFEITYRLINGFSLLGLIFMMITGYIQGKKRKVSSLFLVGLACLVLGGFVFILGNLGVIDSPFITQNALKTGTLVEMIFLSILMVGRYKTLQEEREKAQQELLVQLEEANVKLEVQVIERTREIELQRVQLKEKNEDFIASVTYAERIQSAVLSNEEKFNNLLPDSFVFFQPKDVVSGDFYWIDTLGSENEEASNFTGYVTADCTGHGVPGALVSIIGNHLLEAGKLSNGLLSPGKALDELSIGMNAALNSRYTSQQLRDGMDLTLCVLDKKERKLYFSGARNSVYVIRNGDLIELKGDRKSIGFNPKEESHEFQTQTLQLEIGDIIYTCSDGYADQFGGPKGKKFMSKRLKALFIEMSSLTLEEQKSTLKETLIDWMGELEQLDDILVIGVQITV